MNRIFLYHDVLRLDASYLHYPCEGLVSNKLETQVLQSELYLETNGIVGFYAIVQSQIRKL